MLALAAKNDKKQIVLGLEPTGYYWFALAAWMISNGISVVQVNPYAVKQSKEVEDNSHVAPIKSTLDKRLQEIKQKSANEADVSVLSVEEERLFVREAMSVTENKSTYKYPAGI